MWTQLLFPVGLSLILVLMNLQTVSNKQVLLPLYPTTQLLLAPARLVRTKSASPQLVLQWSPKKTTNALPHQAPCIKAHSSPLMLLTLRPVRVLLALSMLVPLRITLRCLAQPLPVRHLLVPHAPPPHRLALLKQSLLTLCRFSIVPYTAQVNVLHVFIWIQVLNRSPQVQAP